MSVELIENGKNNLIEVFKFFDERGRMAYCEVLDAAEFENIARVFNPMVNLLAEIVDPYKKLIAAETEEYEANKKEFTPSLGHRVKKLFSPQNAQKEVDAFNKEKQEKLATIRKKIEEIQKEVDAAEQPLKDSYFSDAIDEIYKSYTAHMKEEYEERTKDWSHVPPFTIRRSEVVLGAISEVAKMHPILVAASKKVSKS